MGVLLFGCLLMLGVHCGARRNGRGALLQIPICHQPQMIGLAEQSAVIEPVYCIRLRFRCPKFDPAREPARWFCHLFRNRGKFPGGGGVTESKM